MVSLRIVAFGMLAVVALLPQSRAILGQGHGTLYGTDAGAGSLVKIDAVTGRSETLGRFGTSGIPSLAIDPTSGNLFAGTGGGIPLLYTIDASGLAYLESINASGLPPIDNMAASGLARLVGDTGLGFAAVGGLDFTPDGTLFAAVNVVGNGGSGSDHLAVLDPGTGRATLVGPFGECTVEVTLPSSGLGSCDVDGMEGIAFDTFGNLWGTVRSSTSTPSLYLIDTNSGRATFVSTLVDALGNPIERGLVSLAFECGGSLFGGVSARSSLAGWLVDVNAITGETVPIAPVASQSLGGLAFGTPCGPTRSVLVDIGPGRGPNVIASKGRPLVLVIVHGSPDFAVSSVRFDTVRLAGAQPVRQIEALDDVNRDGHMDVVIGFQADSLNLTEASTMACLTGLTVSGEVFAGCDTIRMR